MFWGCSSLTDVIIPNSVTSIGEKAFYYCTSLHNVNLPSSLTTIGSYAFQYSGLTSIVIPSPVSTIGEFAFQNCTALLSIDIPNTVTNIGQMAFYDSNQLTSVTVRTETPIIIHSPFRPQVYDNATLFVPCGCKAVYETVDCWKEFKNIVEMCDENTESIAEINRDTLSKTQYYDLNGYRSDNNVNGMRIVRNSDGTVRKAIIKRQ